MIAEFFAFCRSVFRASTFTLVWRVGKTQGVRGIALRVKVFFWQGFHYRRWVRTHDRLTVADLSAIYRHTLDLSYQPLISVLLPTFNTPEIWLRKAINSVLLQQYQNWELCIADDASVLPHVARVLAEYARQDVRIRVSMRTVNGHISASTNSALAMARGDFVALLDHDDELAPHALYMVAVKLNENPNFGMLYSDEDKIDERGRRFDPYFKPDWNPTLLESQNLVSHLGVYRTDLLRSIGGFRIGVEGCQDWDAALRISERVVAKNICHIPFVLYHWRTVAGSTAVNHNQKSYVKNAALRVIRDHFERLQQSVSVVPSFGSFVRPVADLPIPNPSVTLIVFGESHPLLFSQSNTNWSALKVIRCTPQKNESLAQAINSIASQVCDDFICLLNSMLVPFHGDWLLELVREACRPGVGAVGPLQLDEHKNIHSTAIVLCTDPNTNKLFNSTYQGLDASIVGIAGLAKLTQNVSVLAPGCLLIRTSTFHHVGALDVRRYPDALFELDLCMRLGQAGLRNVWTPYARLMFHCKLTSNLTDAGSDEFVLFRAHWLKDLDVDPFHNPNLMENGVWPTPSIAPRIAKPWLPFKD